MTINFNQKESIAIQAKSFGVWVNLMLHVPGENLAQVLKFLPKIKLPTVRKLAGEKWYHILTSCKRTEVRKLIPKLKKLGCEDIVEFPGEPQSLENL